MLLIDFNFNEIREIEYRFKLFLSSLMESTFMIAYMSLKKCFKIYYIKCLKFGYCKVM